jgi:hypothetical protein
LPQYTHLTIDGFTFEDWKRYLDLLRGLGANNVTVLSIKHYSPAVPETNRYRPFWETAREAMRYAHRLGIKFGLGFPHNLVPSEVWWRHPELRAETWGYDGINLCSHVGRREIKQAQRPTLEFLKELDELSYMFVDGGADCQCDYCKHHQAKVILESLEMGAELLKEAGSKAKLAPFTWCVDRSPGGALERVLKEAPSGIEIIDSAVQPAPGDSERTGLAIAKAAGRRVTDFLFLTDPEGGIESLCSVFPIPRLAAVAKEVGYAAKLGLEGVVGYRMTPPTQFICDSAVLRLAWEPGLAMEKLVTEIAEAAASRPSDRQRLKSAIWALERFWTEFDLEALREAEELFEKAAGAGAIAQVRYTADGVKALRRLAEETFGTESATLEGKQKDAIYQVMRESYIYQGYTTDEGWIGRSRLVKLNPMIDLWAGSLRLLREQRRKENRG